jgi:hypothetical protein
MFLKVSGQIEGQLREAYAKKHADGVLNQSILADRLGVNRSVVNRRLTGRVNMTEESIADMVWGLEYDIDIDIFDPAKTRANQKPTPPPAPTPPPSPQQAAPTAAVLPNTLGISDGTQVFVATG